MLTLETYMIFYILHHTYLIDGEGIINTPGIANRSKILSSIHEILIHLTIKEQPKNLSQQEMLDEVIEIKDRKGHNHDKLLMIIASEAQEIELKLTEFGHDQSSSQ